ncbi:hypothetical protein AXK12_05095 [Cephaloticoccus capnophilus]|uniref:Release factor glutamine methyltransferase n=1 Tax=Cephaloticoccus capnophilus TaxID=1548208 RepID=A0A139SLR7_9BACT|nr:peptide chain release factor N(5)-glutamine methyltransferase [Cephaloticoccus capnophilus]KXU35499.1 hypothetical protein AXK12_05095 [Cephaloticoccus capnophilus]
MRSVLEIITASSDYLAARGIENARLNAEHLIGHALGLPRMQLYLQFERPLVERELEAIRVLLRRRAAREPLQYIVGETEFFGLTLKVDARALIPRPETEYLVSLLTERLGASEGPVTSAHTQCSPSTPALTHCPPRRILDLGTGTGAIALALAKYWEDAQVVALDASTDALALARENAERNGLADRVEFLASDWFSALASGAEARVNTPFDLIVSNPPYLSAEEVSESLAEVKNHEPAQALSPGQSGMEAFYKIVAEAPRYLRRSEASESGEGAGGRGGAGVRGGVLALETGIAQHAELAGLFREAGFAHYEFLPDLAQRPRYALAWA